MLVKEGGDGFRGVLEEEGVSQLLLLPKDDEARIGE